MNYSLIIPFYNEENNVQNLVDEILVNLKKIKNDNRNFQLIFIDDGSKDTTFEKLKSNITKDFSSVIIKHKNNYSQSTAILTGIFNSKYENIITLDGDGQNDPKDIEKLLKEYEKGSDMVIGWRKNRRDNFFTKTFPSYLANYIVRKFTNSKIHDHGCALKIFKKNKLDDLNNWGDFHRLLAARFSYNDYIVKEIPVNHNERIYGKSNYGFFRVIYVILDLLYIKLFKNYKTKSIYFFGLFGFLSFLFSFLVFLLMIYLKYAYGTSFILTPLPILSVFLFMCGLIFLFIGFISHLITNQSKTIDNRENNVAEKIEFP